MFSVNNFNKSIVPEREVLPVAKKGIITLTLVISREFIKPTVTHGLYVMRLGFLRIKTRLEYQIDEYLTWKGKFSLLSAQTHGDVLSNFVKKFKKYKAISEITLDDIHAFYNDLNSATPFTRIKAMEAIRGFMRYFKSKKQHEIDPNSITNQGVIHLQSVGKSVKITPMNVKKLGRPANTVLARKVKRLRDIEGLSFRSIGKALNKDVKSIYRWYTIDLPLKSLSE